MKLKKRHSLSSRKKSDSIWNRSLHKNIPKLHGLSALLLFMFIIVVVIIFQLAGKIPGNILGLTDETSLYFPTSVDVESGIPFDVPVMLTAINSTVGVDLVAKFDPTQFQLLEVLPQASTSVFGTFAPLNNVGSFDSALVASRANSNGTVLFSALAIDKASGNFQLPFAGQLSRTGPLALLRFKSLQTASGTISMAYSPNSTTESNVVSVDTGKDILINVVPVKVTVRAPVTPTNTPTPSTTIAPTMTPAKTITPTPTRLPGSTPTVAHTPTSTPKPINTSIPTVGATPTPITPPPGGGVVAYSVKSSSDDVNQDGDAIFDTSSGTIWLGSGAATGKSLLGLRFQNVTIPKNSQISSARLKFYVPTSGWINLRVQLAAEKSGNSNSFSTSSKPASRVLTTSKVSHQSNVNWAAGSTILFDEMKSVVQEVVNQGTWNSGNAMSILVKNTSGVAWSRKFVTSYDGNPEKSPQLVISYIPPSGQTIPVPTATLTPTLVPVSTLPGAAQTSTPKPTSTQTPTYTPTPKPTNTHTPSPTTKPTSINTPTPTTNIVSVISNPSFESGGLSGWKTGYSIQVSSDAQSGGVGARISENSDYISQNIRTNLVAGKAYTFSVYVKVLTIGNSWGKPSLRIGKFEDMGTQEYGISEAVNSTSAGWQKLSITKTFSSSELSNNVFIGIKHFGFTGITVVDNFSATAK